MQLKSVWMTRLAVVAIGLGGLTAAAAAADPCSQFKWNVTAETALFRTAPTAMTAARSSAEAPTVGPGTLYELTLHPQELVKLAAPISKKMLDDGAYGGLLKLRLQEPGMYRISVDAGFWLDVADGAATIPSKDFSGSQNCTAPRKVVLYDLPAARDLVIQLTGSGTAHARLTVVQVPHEVP